MRTLLMAAGCMCFLLSGCDAVERAEKAEATAEALREDQARLEKRLSDLELKVWTLEIWKDQYKTATFDPASSEGFQRIDTTCCSFAVSVESVKANADGAKVRIQVGNFSSATFRSGTFKVKWGPRKSDSVSYADWMKSLREKEQEFLSDLMPGRWNSIDLVLPGVPPDKLGYIELGLETNQIRLYTK